VRNIFLTRRYRRRTLVDIWSGLLSKNCPYATLGSLIVHRIRTLGYVVLGVHDLDEAINFYSRFVRLDLTERVGRTAFMTGGPEHYWLRLEEASKQGVRSIGYEVADAAALAAIRSELTKRGMKFREGDGSAGTNPVTRFLNFTDPGGFEIELYLDMQQRPIPALENGIAFEKFLHGGWEVADFGSTNEFYANVLGFKMSDNIANAVSFLRCGDGFHHSAVLIRSRDGKSRFNHFCIEVGSIDDVMRFRHNAVAGGLPIRDDLLRHAASDSIGVYVMDEARGFAVEFCTGHRRVDDLTHRARVLPLAPETVDVWRAPFPEPRLTWRETSPPGTTAGKAASSKSVDEQGGESFTTLFDRQAAG
jgi:2,3-dihydroxy-p-cumate/2,3-dihydroxybenzoate 3,4-dioxygenase